MYFQTTTDFALLFLKLMIKYYIFIMKEYGVENIYLVINMDG